MINNIEVQNAFLFSITYKMNILITGVTGFLGKVFLLDIINNYGIKYEKIYVLIRGKKNLSSKQRFRKMCNNIHLKKKFEPFLNKIYILDGSLEKENLDLDVSVLKSLDIDIVVNNAASVKFNDEMQTAYTNNFITSMNLLDTSKRYFTKLKKFIHLSTFYVNLPKNNEHNIDVDYEQLLKDVKTMNLDEINQKYDFSFENTYVFTKFLSEYFILKNETNFKKYIIRPSIIANSYNFPLPGWNDSFAAYTGFNVSFGTGIVKYLLTDKDNGFNIDTKLNIVPVDYVSQVIIETIENNYTSEIIDASINNKQLVTIKELKNSLNYYNILNYNGEYKFMENPWFCLYNFFCEYIYYQFIYYITFLFNTQYSKKVKFICDNVCNINNTFFYYIHNEWSSEAKLTNFDMDYYHNVIVPNGNSKYLLNKDLNEYSVIKENKHYFTANWLINKYNNNLTTNLAALFLRNAFSNIFNDVKIDIEKLIDIIYKNDHENLIICPNHRSYCDFLLMSYIFYELKSLGINLPLIAATSDFKNIPVIGTLFEKLGCFYVERGKGKSEELNEKIKRYVNRKENIEFFVEGTRSRTRQTIKSKTGLIKSLQQTGKQFKILPVTFSYEKIPEQNVFIQEILSGKKSKMSIKDLLLWGLKRTFQTEKYGNVFVKFSDLIELNPESNPNEIGRNLCREYQVNSVYTDYHFKFNIEEGIKNHQSGLKTKNHSSIIEEWICMNQWIFTYIYKKNCKNWWEKEYFDLYDFTDQKDKIQTNSCLEYHKKYFSYVNSDINIILQEMKSNEFSNIDPKKLTLGNTCLVFVKKILEKYNINEENSINFEELYKKNDEDYIKKNEKVINIIKEI